MPLRHVEPVAIAGHDGLVCVCARIAEPVEAVLGPGAPLRDDLRVAQLRAAGQIHYLDGRIVDGLFVGERLHPEHPPRLGRIAPQGDRVGILPGASYCRLVFEARHEPWRPAVGAALPDIVDRDATRRQARRDGKPQPPEGTPLVDDKEIIARLDPLDAVSYAGDQVRNRTHHGGPGGV